MPASPQTLQWPLLNLAAHPALEALPGTAPSHFSLILSPLPGALCVPASQPLFQQLAGHTPHLWASAHAHSLSVWLTHPFFRPPEAFPDAQQGQVALRAARLGSSAPSCNC